jgi:hypothetical protein
VLDPGFNPNTSTLDLPFDRNSWFKLLSLDQLRYEIGIAAVDDLFLRTDQMRQLAELLGARATNLKQYLPSYTPPAPHISFFNRHPSARTPDWTARRVHAAPAVLSRSSRQGNRD